MPTETGVSLIRDERIRQCEKEGWTPEHDDGHTDGQLAMAGAAYAICAQYRRGDDFAPWPWPWAKKWWKSTPNDRVRELVKAGALIAAEIDRLLRLRENQN